MKTIFLALLLIALPETKLWSEEKTSPAEEVVEIQGIKIWKKGSPTNTYTTIANESLMNVTQPEAQNRIALGVRARKGNAAIITSMTAAQRLDITQNTGINRLDGLNVRYAIIQLKP
jgi:hypothetical protein